MAKEHFQQELHAMLAEGSGSRSLDQVLDGLTALLRRHSSVFTGVTGSYRLTASDSGVNRAFALKDGQYQPLGDADAVDVTIIGKEEHLLAIFNKKLKPAGALLTGKLKVKGSLAALNTLAAYL